jgi:hypothetical protein
MQMTALLSSKKWLMALIISATTLTLPSMALATPIASSDYSVVTNESEDETPLLVIGQISNIHLDTNTLTINGQSILLDSQTTTESSGGVSYGLAGLNKLFIGDHVAVSGELMDPGLSLATTIIIFDDSYAAGDSTAYLRAIIDSFDASTATAKSGSSSIELSSTEASNISAGSEIEVFGSAYGTTFIANTLSNLSNTEAGLLAIRGSGVRAIRGSGVRAIRGSGVRAIRGSGVRAIRGSGVRAIRGSGVRAIRGSGVRAIRGSGVRAIRGSGVRAIRGSGVRAIRGSGVRAISGADTK